jgi:hypothetical protein
MRRVEEADFGEQTLTFWVSCVPDQLGRYLCTAVRGESDTSSNSLCLIGGIVYLLSTTIVARIGTTGGEEEKAPTSPPSAVHVEMAATADPIDESDPA